MSALHAIFGFTAWAGVVLGIAIACYGAAALILREPDNEIVDEGDRFDERTASVLNAPVFHSTAFIEGVQRDHG